MEYYENIKNTVNPKINNVLDNIFGKSTSGQSDSTSLILLKICLILYGSVIAPKLPIYILEWFDYVPFKIFVLFLIGWNISHDGSLSILIAICFYASLNILNGKKMFENYKSCDTFSNKKNTVQFN